MLWSDRLGTPVQVFVNANIKTANRMSANLRHAEMLVYSQSRGRTGLAYVNMC